VEQQGITGELLHLGAERVDRLVARDDLHGKPFP
jgi:hypothetical protein